MIRNVDPFPLGMVVATPGALAALALTAEPASKFLDRHSKGDWGTVGPEDWKSNDDALKFGARLVSAYKLSDGTALWIITEFDRSATTLLMPHEY